MEPLDDKTLAELEKSNPDLVAQYRQKMAAPTADLQAAKDMQSYGDVADVAGHVLNNFGNANRPKDAILYNRMDQLGKAPTVNATPERQYDDMGLGKTLGRGVDQAKEALHTAEGTFNNEQKLQDLGQSREDQSLVRGDHAKARAASDRSADPKSAESAAAREFLKSRVPNAANIPGFDQMSEAQVQKVTPGLFDSYKLDQEGKLKREEMAQRSADRAAASADRSADREAMRAGRQDDKVATAASKEGDYQAQINIPGLEVKPGFRPTVQGAAKIREAKTTADNMRGTLDAMDGIYKDSGTNIIGDDSVAQGQYAESLRMQLKDLLKLGALSASDYDALNKQVPDPTSVKENVKGLFNSDSYGVKSKVFRQDLESRLKNTASNGGYSVTEAAKEPRTDVFPGRGKGTKPATVTQNGHTYTLNEATGEYE